MKNPYKLLLTLGLWGAGTITLLGCATYKSRGDKLSNCRVTANKLQKVCYKTLDSGKKEKVRVPNPMAPFRKRKYWI